MNNIFQDEINASNARKRAVSSNTTNPVFQHEIAASRDPNAGGTDYAGRGVYRGHLVGTGTPYFEYWRDVQSPTTARTVQQPGSGSRSGGYGGYGGVNPLLSDAYAQLIADYGATPLVDIGAINERYDSQVGDIDSARRKGARQSRRISRDIADRTNEGRAAVDQSFRDRQAAIRQLAGEFGTSLGSTENRLNSVLGAFDAGSVQADQAAMNRSLAATQAALTGTAGVWDAGFADRARMADVFGADIRQGQATQSENLTNAIARQRAAELSAAQQTNDQRAIDDQRAINQLRLQAAQQGVKL